MKFSTLLSIATIALISLTALADEKPASPNQTSSHSLFDGKTLKGWKTAQPKNKSRWSVVNGSITSGDGVSKVQGNTYLCTTTEYEDFEFRCQFRITGDHKTGLINSGIQYRSSSKKGHIIGYQADIGKGYWGDIYDEHRRNRALVKGNTQELFKTLKEDAWNSYLIRCKGNRHQLFINGIQVADYVEKDTNIPAKGIIGIQLHNGGNAKIELKAITISILKL